MKNKAKQAGKKGKPYDYSNDFKVLTKEEKREIVKTAKNLLKLQKENDLLADAPASPMEAEKEGLT
jgi:hypothetical protein